MGVSEELLIRVNAEMEGVDLKICSVKTNLAKACFKGLLQPTLLFLWSSLRFFHVTYGGAEETFRSLK